MGQPEKLYSGDHWPLGQKIFLNLQQGVSFVGSPLVFPNLPTQGKNAALFLCANCPKATILKPEPKKITLLNNTKDPGELPQNPSFSTPKNRQNATGLHQLSLPRHKWTGSPPPLETQPCSTSEAFPGDRRFGVFGKAAAAFFWMKTLRCLLIYVL